MGRDDQADQAVQGAEEGEEQGGGAALQPHSQEDRPAARQWSGAHGW